MPGSASSISVIAWAPSDVNASNAPFVLNANVTRTLDAQPATTVPAGGTSPAGGYDPSNVVANSLQWNFTVEQSFGKSTTLEVAYVGNHALHQLNSYDINYVPQSQWLNAAFQPNGNVDSLRRFPGWSTMAWWLNNGDATYHSLCKFCSRSSSRSCNCRRPTPGRIRSETSRTTAPVALGGRVTPGAQTRVLIAAIPK